MTAGTRVPQGIFMPPRTATFVVAASNSTPMAKAQADRVCDGVDDDVEIQELLDELPAAGGVVLLQEGTYNVSSSIEMWNNQTLRGEGWCTVIETNTANLDIIYGGGGIQQVCIEKLQIDGNDVNDVGILLENVQNSQILNCYIHHNGESGIQLRGTNTIKIANNVFLNSSAWYSIYLDTVINTEIVDNTDLQSDYCIYTNGGCWPLLISRNNLTATGAGCWISPGADYCKILDNFIASDSRGLYVDECDYIHICRNFVSESGAHSLDINDCTYAVITDNQVYRSGPNGIDLNGVMHSTIKNNIVFDTDQNGIYLSGCDHNIIEGNQVSTVGQDADNAYDCIKLNSSDYNLIKGNQCRMGDTTKDAKYGLTISGTKNRVIGNDLEDSGQTANLYDNGSLTHVEDDNIGITIDQIRHYRLVKNTYQNPITAGYVVSLKAVAAGNEVTMPTALNERQVYGMAAEDIAVNALGLVLVKGKTTILLSGNIQGNIAIGDFLVTSNGWRAVKCAADSDAGIFARALEACAVAACTIDAFVMSPWD